MQIIWRTISQTFHPQKELDHLRKISRQAEGELLVQKDSARKAEKKFGGDLDAIRKELNRCYKQNQEMDVTNSELKEEVSTVWRFCHQASYHDKVNREKRHSSASLLAI